MKLKHVWIDGFRSVKDRVKLLVDPRISILIGANDHGKTTLLEAIKCLNEDRPITTEDENWDSVGKGKPALEYRFELDPDEFDELTAIGLRYQEDERNRKAVERARNDAAAASHAPDDEPTALVSLGISADAVLIPADTVLPPVPRVVEFSKTGIGGPLTLKSDPYFDGVPEAGPYLAKCVPRVELFVPVDQIMDAVTLEELDNPDQEFMQGVFRYAGMWDGHDTLFRQDPATTRRLEKASTDFTRRIHDEWRQGENLEFNFQHAGKNGVKD